MMALPMMALRSTTTLLLLPMVLTEWVAMGRQHQDMQHQPAMPPTPKHPMAVGPNSPNHNTQCTSRHNNMATLPHMVAMVATLVIDTFLFTEKAWGSKTLA